MKDQVIDFIVRRVLNTILKVALAGFFLGVLLSAGVYYAVR